VKVSTVRSEQHASKGPAEREQPVTRPSAHCAGGAPDQVRNHNPRLFGDECGTDQAVRAQVGQKAGLHEQRRADGTDQIQQDPDHEHRSGR
jgi:hypothetical protein